MTINISINGLENKEISKLLYEYFKNKNYKVKLCQRNNHKLLKEIKKTYNLSNHEIALVNALDKSLTTTNNDFTKYDIVIWQGSIISDYVELADNKTLRLFIKQINRFSPKIDYHYYIKPTKNTLKNNTFKDLKNLIILNNEDDINKSYKTIINHLNETYPHCKWCEKIFKPTTNQKYCSKTCNGLARRKQNRDKVKRFYNKYGRKTTASKYNTDLGSNASLKQHKQENFEKEHKAILNEKKRLGI